MDSKINTQNTGLRVEIDSARTRQAPRTDFGSVMSTGLSRGTDAVLNAGQLAAPFIPGGAVLSAAISGVGQLKSSVQGAGTATTAGALRGGNSVGLTAGGTPSGGSGTGTTTGALGSGSSQDWIDKMQAYQEMNQSFNMQYLALQQKMQDESRRFSVISNIMKTKHDTAKNSISNVR